MNKALSTNEITALSEVKPKKQIMLRNSGFCAICKEELVSKHRHDFVQCNCGGSYVDGGLAYQRCGGSLVDTAVWAEEDDIATIREYFTWSSFGPKGDQPKHYILLKDLTRKHIENILATQVHIWDTHVEKFFKLELEYREDNS